MFSELISEYMPDVRQIDMGLSAAKYIKTALESTNSQNGGEKPATHKFFVSDKAVTFEKTVKIFLGPGGDDIEIDLVDVEKYEKSHDKD